MERSGEQSWGGRNGARAVAVGFSGLGCTGAVRAPPCGAGERPCLGRGVRAGQHRTSRFGPAAAVWGRALRVLPVSSAGPARNQLGGSPGLPPWAAGLGGPFPVSREALWESRLRAPVRGGGSVPVPGPARSCCWAGEALARRSPGALGLLRKLGCSVPRVTPGDTACCSRGHLGSP